MELKELGKIYVVNAGTYSDYRIVALFSTRDRAEEFMSTVPVGSHDDDFNDIEEYDLDPNTAELIKHGYSLWSVEMLADGTAELVKRIDAGVNSIARVGHEIHRRTLIPYYRNKGLQDCLSSVVLAKTEKQAVKIVNERRVQMIASGDWH